jgi:hypothetical protein
MEGLTPTEESMATYGEIIDRVRQPDGFVAQTCWIAEVKASHGLTRGEAPNRISSRTKVKPCPPHRRAAIERALVHFGMV